MSSEKVKNHTNLSSFKEKNYENKDYNILIDTTANNSEWQKVKRKGTHKKEESPRTTNVMQANKIEIPLQNQFSKLTDITTCEDDYEYCPKNKCENCGFELKSRNSLEQHKQSAHGQKIINKDEMINRLKSQLAKEVKDPKETKKAYATLEKNIKAVKVN